jgi:hypothetical protein
MRDLVAVFVEAGRVEQDVEGLPLARRAAGVYPGRMAADPLLANPLMVDASARAVRQLCGSPAIKDLDLVFPQEVDARVGAFRDDELDVQLAIAMLRLGVQIGRAPGRPVDQHALPWRDVKESPIISFQGCVPHNHPVMLAIGALSTPRAQRLSIKQLDPFALWIVVYHR